MIELLKWAMLALGAILAIGLGTFLAGALALARRADQKRNPDTGEASRHVPHASDPADDGPVDTPPSVQR